MIEPGSPSATAPLLRVEGVRKRFGGVIALRGVNLSVLPGEVHALLGENGAGKSTLIKILSGVQGHDGGLIEIDGRPASFSSPAQSRQAGVAVVYQDLSLVESLSVADNLLLGREPRNRFGFLRKRQLLAEAQAFLSAQNIALDPRAMVGSLPFAYRQMTEICKALMGDVRLLILDEPTSALTDDEERILFDAIRKAAARGVGVIYVTHRLNEVFRISNRVTVFRDGQNAGTFVTADTNMRQLVGAIVGPDHAVLKTAVAEAGDAASSSAPFQSVLRLRGVSNDRLDRVDLELRAGEIHGLAGLIGSGRTEILQTIFGLRPVAAGEASLDAKSLKGVDPAAAIARGIALVPEDRQVQGLVLEHSIERNLTLPRLPDFSRMGWLERRSAAEQADSAMQRLRVRAPNAATAVKNLSGGNQQKVVFGKWNQPVPRVLLLDEPTVGVDVGAREEIYGVIRNAAAAGSGVLMVSSDLPELVQLCDRVSIVVDGRIVKTIARAELGSAEDLHHMIQLSQPSEEHAA
ncbi:sugar ABC transporter ATP-binding protein [Mesorhizobium sp. CU2]|uniref:sugar ABC transporter ATP-binding protein n=1 Tax=unclassified Mesorhizobium TaxID=325217 RepID=UPI0011268852|nr:MULTISPECIES: sugar ABC transporter ATP-binding protein [unclassified Mesorhizobium]TPN76706.1 sugar ABC transporter ATP-binding protein [Mesorhizobium sp. CU3]TPO01571.1 sugar ABC transporter ATP-binding protein [Mesorhizobium sp. CU2]